MIKTHSPLRKKRAQALAEMAVMVPFLVIAMMGFLDLGRALYYQIALTNAVREAARYGVQPAYLGINTFCSTGPVPGPNCPVPVDSTICTYVGNELTSTGFTVSCTDVQVIPAQDVRVQGVNGAAGAYRGPLTVTGSYKFTFITPIIGSLFGGSITVRSAATMRAEY
jgi:TadE-like protein